VFSNVVSPEITGHFKTIVQDIIKNSKMNDTARVKAGPPKTLARSYTKTHKYMEEFHTEKNQRWDLFHKKFKSTFKREPSKPEDFVWNVMDFARCCIVVPTACDVLKLKKLFEKKLKVVCVKNGYSTEYKVKGSGYRDLKLLVKVDFDNLKLKGIPQMVGRTTMICELQLLCETWLHNKLTTSTSYKVLRSDTLRELLSDFSKYLAPWNAFKNDIYPTKVLKNGWINMAKATNFAHIDASQHLLEASQNGWEVAAINILVNKLGADLETKDIDGRTPAAWCSRRGYSALLNSLIDLKADIENADKHGFTALHHAVKGRHEESVRLLLAAKSSCSAEDFLRRTPLDIANNQNLKRIQNILKGEKVPRLNKLENKQVSTMDMLMTAAIENSLADFLDTHDLKRSAVSTLFSSQAVATAVENILQVLWFGADVNHVNKNGLSALCFAVKHGTLKTVNLILEANANVNIQTFNSRWSPLHLAINFGTPQIVTALLDANANTELRAKRGWTVLHMAVGNGNGKMISLLLKAGANINAKLDDGRDAMSLAEHNKENVDEVTSLIKAAIGSVFSI